MKPMPAKTPAKTRPKKPRRRCLPREKARRTITVCDACYRASCWQAKHFCDEHREAGTTEATRMELALLNLEHSDYWKISATA